MVVLKASSVAEPPSCGPIDSCSSPTMLLHPEPALFSSITVLSSPKTVLHLTLSLRSADMVITLMLSLTELFLTIMLPTPLHSALRTVGVLHSTRSELEGVCESDNTALLKSWSVSSGVLTRAVLNLL